MVGRLGSDSSARTGSHLTVVWGPCFLSRQLLLHSVYVCGVDFQTPVKEPSLQVALVCSAASLVVDRVCSRECLMVTAVCVPWPPPPNDVLVLRQRMCLQNETQNSDCPLLMDALFQALLGSSLPRIPKERIRNLVFLSPLM